MAKASSIATMPPPTQISWREKYPAPISAEALRTVSRPTTESETAATSSPQRRVPSCARRGRSSGSGSAKVGLRMEESRVEGLRQRRRGPRPLAAVLDEDHHHQLGVARRRVGGEPGVVAQLPGEEIGVREGLLRGDLHGAGLAGDLDVGQARA